MASPRLDSSASLITTRQLTKRYGNVTALDALEIDVAPGIIGLVGSNGAGKSTFLRILLGLHEPSDGSAQVLGMDALADTFEVRKYVGYMPEHDCLPVDVSATDFVTHMGRMSGLPAKAARERAAETLRHVGLHEERYRLIGGYSTGMKQRVKLAQALVHDPRLLLLDEPTNGLDPAGREDMLGLVERTGREFGIAILVTSHLLGEIERVCDTLIAIESGRLRFHGSVSEFTSQTQRLVVEVDDGAEQLAASLATQGVAVTTHGQLLRLDAEDEGVFDIVRDAAAALDIPIARLELERHQLGELFSGAAQ
jgi:ABC-2 type transport system ATP-binding protein